MTEVPATSPKTAAPRKYRASCDACNEAKLRCSRSKPSCARCEKSQIVCIYGLRKSQTTAPRPANSVSVQQHSEASSVKGYLASPAASRRSMQSNVFLTSPPDTCGKDEANASGSRTPNDFSDVSGSVFDPSMGTNPTFDDQCMDFVFDQFDIGSVDGLSGYSVTSQQAFADLLGPGSSLASETTAEESGIDTDPQITCSMRIVAQLASTRLTSVRRGAPLDVQLSSLKDAISLASQCLRSPDHEWDDMAPLTMTVLLGSIIAGFESSVEDLDIPTDPRKSSASSLIPSEAVAGHARFRWGALQIDNADELASLHQYMWLLQFQRVDGLLKSFQEQVKHLKQQSAGQPMSRQMLAPDNLQTWLEQRTQHVEQKFSAKSGISRLV